MQYKLTDLQDMAYKLLARPKPSKLDLPTYLPDGSTAAIFGYWLSHKNVGTPITKEFDVHPDDGGGVALVTIHGIILHWVNGQVVEK